MDPMDVISVGALQNIFANPLKDHLPPIVLQCLQTKTLAPTAQGLERFRAVLSDSVHFIQCMLASQLNHFIHSQELTKGCIVRLKSYQANQVNNRRVLIIVDIDILKEYGLHERIGAPDSLEKMLATLGEVQPNPVPTAPTAPKPAATSATSFYTNKPTPAPQAQKPRFVDPAKRSTGGSGNAHICPIEALSPYQNKWTIKARVTQKSDIKTWKNQRGEGKLFTVNLLDETGEIRATGFGDQCDSFFDVLQVGQVYYISKCRVNMAKKQFSNLSNDYELQFDRETEIEQCPDESDVPMVKFNFIPLGELNSVDKDAVVDVIGVVKEVQDVSEIISKTTNKPYQKRELTLVDTSGFSVRMTVWGANALNWDTPTESVVAFKGVKVGDYGGRSLSMLMSSSMTVDPDIDEAHKLKGWFDAQGRNESFSSHQNLSGMGAAGGRKDVYKTLGQVTEERLGQSDEPDYYSVRATIVYIKQTNCTYPACATEGCNKKVSQIGEGQWRCEKCQKLHPRAQHRYIMSISVNDAFSQAWFSCFDDVGRLIMGMTGDELEEIRSADESGAYMALFNNANGKTYNFRVRAKLDMYKDEQRVRHQVMSAAPLNYAVECAKLAEIIKLYSQD